MTIINKITHSVEWSSIHKENWMGDDWIIVPEHLEATARACGGYCELVFDAGELVGITPTERPAVPQTTIITPQDDTDAMLVDLEYRVTLLELGLTDE